MLTVRKREAVSSSRLAEVVVSKTATGPCTQYFSVFILPLTESLLVVAMASCLEDCKARNE
jgi:hypothetical protein